MKRVFRNLWYLTTSIILPIVIISSPFILINIGKIIFTSYFENTTPDTIKELGVWIPIILSIFMYISARKILADKEFLAGNLYAQYPRFIYYIAGKLLNYGKFNLERKPFYVQFYVVLNDVFRDVTYSSLPENKKLKIKEDYTDYNLNQNQQKCNLIISDTYSISKSQLPDEVKDYTTIKIEREKDSLHDRIYSEELIHAVSKAIEKIKMIDAEINLFLTTNTKNTYEIINKVFKKGGRERYTINLFQQGDKGNRNFKRKAKKFNTT